MWYVHASHVVIEIILYLWVLRLDKIVAQHERALRVHHSDIHQIVERAGL